MPAYRVRVATLADADALVHHRVGMFTDMGVSMDAAVVADRFRRWLLVAMPAGTYRAWVVETSDDASRGAEAPEVRIIAGGGITVLPWPPGPRDASDRLAFVYNVYTEPAHRRRGLARRLMETIHAWCRAAGISSVALNTSVEGRLLYESLGYRESDRPMMFLALE